MCVNCGGGERDREVTTLYDINGYRLLIRITFYWSPFKVIVGGRRRRRRRRKAIWNYRHIGAFTHSAVPFDGKGGVEL